MAADAQVRAALRSATEPPAWPRMAELVARARSACARLVGAGEDEIAFVKNTREVVVQGQDALTGWAPTEVSPLGLNDSLVTGYFLLLQGGVAYSLALLLLRAQADIAYAQVGLSSSLFPDQLGTAVLQAEIAFRQRSRPTLCHHGRGRSACSGYFGLRPHKARRHLIR